MILVDMLNSKKIAIITVWLLALFFATRHLIEYRRVSVLIPIIYLIGAIGLFFVNKFSIKWLSVYIVILIIGFVAFLQDVVYRINIL